MIKLQLAPLKYKQLAVAQAQNGGNKENLNILDEYKPFNIAEMEIEMKGNTTLEAKQDEVMKMYQQMGLLF